MALSLSLAAPLADAQPSSAPNSVASTNEAVVAPRPLTPLHVDYPDGAQGDATVVLIVTIDASGSVTTTRVVEGAEPFARAAAKASAALRFEPAQRGGKRVPAAIRVETRFRAPEPKAEPSLDVGTPSNESRPRLEVTVRGEARASGGSSSSSLTATEVFALPGAFGDPFRAIEALPSVTTIVSGMPFYFIRGSPPGNVGYYLDGIRVPLLFHVGFGPSVVNPAIIERVDVHAGGYPAKFGRFAGGIVSGEIAPPPTEWHGSASVRLIDAGAMIGGPFADGKGSVFVSGRYSYTGAVLSVVTPSTSIGYWDYQLRATYRLSPRDEVGIFVFGAHDSIGSDDVSPIAWNGSFDTTFHRADLRYDRRLGGPEDHLRQSITLGYDETTAIPTHIRNQMLASRTTLSKRVSDSVLVHAGLDAELDSYRGEGLSMFGPIGAGTLPAGGRMDSAVGLYADAVLRLAKGFEVTPGLRVDAFTSQGTTVAAVDPRLSARLAITDRLSLVQAYGLASQPPAFLLPLPGFQESLEGGLQRTFQASAGVELSLSNEIQAAATLFRNVFINMTDPMDLADSPYWQMVTGYGSAGDARARIRGSSMGLELMVRRRLTRHFGGLLSYTLSRSIREGTPWYASLKSVGARAARFDRTHVLSAATVYDFGRGYTAGTRILFYTGVPLFAETSHSHTYGQGTYAEVGRVLPFFRFDLRAAKRWRLGASGWITAVLEAQNLLFGRERDPDLCMSITYCNRNPSTSIVLPSLGVEAGF